MALLDDILNKKELDPVPTTETTAAAPEAGGSVMPLQLQDNSPMFKKYTEDNGNQGGQQMPRQLYNPDENFYQNAFRALNKGTAPESEADMKAREKKEKSRSTILALADGLSHIANIWGATQGASPMQISSLSDANRQRYEYADEIRRKNADRYREGSFNAMAMDRQEAMRRAQERYQADLDRRNWDYKIQRDEIKDNQWRQSTEATQAYRAQQQKSADEKLKHEKERDERNYKLNVQKLNAQIAGNKANGGNTYYSDPKNFTIIPGTGGNPIAIPRNVGEGFYNKYAQKIKDANMKLATTNSTKDSATQRSNLIKLYYESPNTNANQAIVESFLQDFPELETELRGEVDQYMNYQNSNPQTIQPKSTASPGSATNASVPITPSRQKQDTVQPEQIPYNQSDLDEINSLIGLPVPSHILDRFGVYNKLNVAPRKELKLK